jgi:hypothetical protein
VHNPLSGRTGRLAIGAAAALALIAPNLAHAATDTTVVVRPSNMQGWAFVDDTTDGPGTGTLVNGPATPPLGTGSVQLAVTGPADRQIVATTAHAGTRLADVTALDYWSYQSGPTLALSLQFDVRYHPTDVAYGGRLVFEPYQSGTVGSGWQHNDALAGVWWASKTTLAGSNGLCPQASPCTWAQVLTNWPDAAMSEKLLLKAGGNWQASSYNGDAVRIGVSGDNTTYDFEQDVTLTSKDACKNGGWATSTAPTYRNQGECVSSFTKNK